MKQQSNTTGSEAKGHPESGEAAQGGLRPLGSDADGGFPKETTGQRNFTILLILARLGLRASEIMLMTLDDIDWEAGELLVRGKGARHERLPLPRDVGEAIATYLRRWQPQCITRRLFVCLKAPIRGFST